MVKTKDINDTEGVDLYIKKLAPELAAIIETIRQLILNTDPLIDERIKWNSPSYFYTGDMKPFDPKTYKRDLVVFNLRNDQITLVFPTGAKIKDSGNLPGINTKDGRKIITIKDVADVTVKKEALQHLIKEWIKMTD
ncbi:DUF1801 domain-containing protein [Pedobacter metabolipauper]|uniref:Uncharacterized protein DUF1801 n=1 Tax=Pedobacter metabolipauper TaxID=425513 RepID=A0A4R6SZ04_9SPHI|nr:DUF1801 domain-containing protein [Pedobacter metabolipauper]TDQ11282.1 uncharacterized protein DUF1801 [Pedobacter metabolipauper]